MAVPIEFTHNNNAKKAIVIFAVILFGAGLAMFAYLGIYNRYWADDWCYNADFKELGFIGTVKGYTYITTYASNRYSLTLFSGIFYSLGIVGVQIMTPLNILLLFIGLYWTLRNLRRIANVPLPMVALALGALITIYYSIYLAPLPYQSLYWRSGSLPYFEPMVTGIFTLALITYQGTLAKPSLWLAVAIALASFLTGGFSEAACATLLTSLILFLAIILFFRKEIWARRSLSPVIVALLAVLLSMVLLMFSPTSAHRLELYGQPASFTELPFLILKFSSDFVKFSFIDRPLPQLAVATTSLFAGYLLYVPEKRPWSTKHIVMIVLMILAFAFLLIAASYAPSAYIERTPPHPRTRIIPTFVLTLAVVLVAWILGSLARRLDHSHRYYLLAVLLFFFTSLYTARTIWIASHNISLYSERARTWDQRALQIESGKRRGLVQINVTAIDGSPVGGIRDFDVKGQGKPGYWINKCAARYYGVEAIDVISPP
jgi:hypothetical protein